MLSSFYLLLLYFAKPAAPAAHQMLGRDRMVCTDEYVLTGPDLPEAKYAWSTGETSRSISVKETGYYDLTVTTRKGGTMTDEVYLNFDMDSIALPNILHYSCGYRPAWDPECLTLLVPHPEDFHLWLFDRWGRLMLETDNPETGWCPHETNLPIGTYVYRIETQGCDGERIEKNSQITFYR